MATPEKWRTIYPQYINRNLTIERGRRLGKEKCVAEPKWQEIFDVLNASPNFEVAANPHKIYNRELDKENRNNQGYVKYVCNDPKLKTKDQVLAYVASMIPKLKSRTNPKQSDSRADSDPSNTGGGQGGSGGGGGGGKKKNRRK